MSNTLKEPSIHAQLRQKAEASIRGGSAPLFTSVNTTLSRNKRVTFNSFCQKSLASDGHMFQIPLGSPLDFRQFQQQENSEESATCYLSSVSKVIRID